MDEAPQKPARIRERIAVRVTSFFLGVYFIAAVPVASLIHERLRVELASAPVLKLVLFSTFVRIGVAVGLIFTFVGVSGYAPSWLQRCAKTRPVK
jgi:hypothetical protein